jgi:carbon-monoxide dehydrogenase catalytic subunit
MAKKLRTPEEASHDPASIDLLQLASESEIETAFTRADVMAPCPIGSDGMCCKVCGMGPCRLVKKGQTGIHPS